MIYIPLAGGFVDFGAAGSSFTSPVTFPNVRSKFRHNQTREILCSLYSERSLDHFKTHLDSFHYKSTVD